MGGHKELPEDKATVRKRERDAVHLRTVGRLTWDEVAREVGYANHSAAQKAVERALRRDIRTDAEPYRAEMLKKYDVMDKALMPRILRGDEKAMDQSLKIDNARRKLIGGLEVPVEQRIEIKEVSETEAIDWLGSLATSYLSGVVDGAKSEEADTAEA